MERTKIAVCFGDKEYKERFVRCWLHHFSNNYEVYVFDGVKELVDHAKEYEVILLEGMDQEELSFIDDNESQVFYLAEEETFSSEKGIVLFKYQEIYKIEQQLRNHISEDAPKENKKNRTRRQIGVFSLDQEIYQIPFCAVIASEYAKDRKCVLLNLQIASGLESQTDLGMEELLVVAATNCYTKLQLQDAIVQECGWDYIGPAKNTQYLAGTSIALYDGLFDILTEALSYDTFIINFGQMFDGSMEMMNRCDEFYLLVPQGEYKTRREKAFVDEITQYGFESLLDKIIRIEIPNVYNPYEPWRSLAEKWRWNEIGDQLRGVCRGINGTAL